MVEGVGSVMPGLMTHRGEALEEEMNEGGEECWAGIGCGKDEGLAAMYSFTLQHGEKHG